MEQRPDFKEVVGLVLLPRNEGGTRFPSLPTLLQTRRGHPRKFYRTGRHATPDRETKGSLTTKSHFIPERTPLRLCPVSDSSSGTIFPS